MRCHVYTSESPTRVKTIRTPLSIAALPYVLHPVSSPCALQHFQLKMAGYDCFGPFCGTCGCALHVASCAYCCPGANVEILDDAEVVMAMKMAADADGFATVGQTIITVQAIMPSAPHPDLMRLFSMMLCPLQIVVFYFGPKNGVCRFSSGWAELLQPNEGLSALLKGSLCYVITGGSLSSVHLASRVF